MEAFEKRRRPRNRKCGSGGSISDCPNSTARGGSLFSFPEQLAALVDMPGYLHILHPAGSCGVTAGHTDKRDMLPPLHDRTYFARPVNRRTGKCGVDHGMVRRLFGALF